MARAAFGSPPRASWEPAQGSPLTYDILVVTPMFGDGYEPRQIDTEDSIRPSAIRGHLRFWWRATAGSEHGTPQQLFQAEEALWGSVAAPSLVAILVSSVEMARPEPSHDTWDKRTQRHGFPRPRFGAPGYALFPFQGSARGREEPDSAAPKGKFRLSIVAAPHHEQAVRTAVRAWLLYGGIGARARRGCGSLEWAGAHGDSFGWTESAASPHVPALPGAHYVLGPEKRDAVSAWREAVETYRDFRQIVGFARNPGRGQRPGRSRWPEADEVRRCVDAWADAHPPRPQSRGFPCADLGLPIVFHFQTQGNSAGDPTTDAVLEGPSDGQRRFASPVITKCLPVGNGRYRPLLLVLNAPHVWQNGDLRLKCGTRSTTVTPADVELSPAQRKNLPHQTDQPIREALLDFVAGRWRSTVQEVR